MSCVLIRHLAFKFTYLKKKKFMNLHSPNAVYVQHISDNLKYGKPKKNPKFFKIKKENKHHITYILMGRKKKKLIQKTRDKFLCLMMGPLDTSLGTKSRIHDPTCQNRPSGNPRELNLGYLGLGLGLGLQIWKGKT